MLFLKAKFILTSKKTKVILEPVTVSFYYVNDSKPTIHGPTEVFHTSNFGLLSALYLKQKVRMCCKFN